MQQCDVSLLSATFWPAPKKYIQVCETYRGLLKATALLNIDDIEVALPVSHDEMVPLNE